MILSSVEGLLLRLIRRSAAGHGFLLVCLALSIGGAISAAYPVTAVVLPAVLLAPRRWRQITLITALGSALGATLLMIAFYQLGWTQIYERFPQMASHASWQRVMTWVSAYDTPALFLIAASPLPQTPALIFFGIARHDPLSVFVAMLAGKLLKYGLLAWLATRFPERFGKGLGGFLGFRRQAGRSR
ncbi:MAG: hypothetical protein ACHQIO_12945 [Nevskiales bacterium]